MRSKRPSPFATATAPRSIGAMSDAFASFAGSAAFAAAGFPLLRDVVLSERDRADHAVIGLAGIVAEGEDAVLVEDKALDGRVLLEDLGSSLGQIEARHDVGHEAEGLAEYLAADLLAIVLIDEAEDRGRMGVVDEFVRQEGVQQCLHRRIGR